MNKKLLSFVFFTLVVFLLCIGAGATNEHSITIDSVSFSAGATSGSITYTIPDSLEGKSVTLIVRATRPEDTSDEGIAYINQYDNVSAGQKTVNFLVRSSIPYGVLTFYVGATDLDTPEFASKLYGVLGDADKDGKITTLDASMILAFIAELSELDSSSTVLGDVDGGLSITTLDASYILSKVAEIEVDYPVGEGA